MPQSTEGFVELPPDSTGKSVRTLQVTTLINNVPTVVYMEVMAVSDANGNVIVDMATGNQMDRILAELRRIRIGIAKLAQDNLFDDGTT
jgi:hypothetical protein